MKTQTITKLNILQEKGVITEDTKRKVEEIDSLLQSKFKTFDDHDSDFMFTHLAMAIDRVTKVNQITDINQFILEQLQQSKVYPNALQLLKSVTELIDTDFNQAEAVMILVHFCSLIEMRG